VNVLLAIDGSHATQKAVRFMGTLFGKAQPEGLSITLFHVVESLPEDFRRRATASQQADQYQQVAEDWVAARKTAGEKLLAEQKTALTSSGIPDEVVEQKLIMRESLPGSEKVIAARAIIDEMTTGEYELVCLGRRGASGAEGSFLGSVAEKVLRQARGRTVWVVD